MALSPADFAAYSRATGTSYPESPEERALMVPEVRAFRQNQLQAQPKQDSETTALGFGIGLGLAALGGGAMALRKGKRIPKKTGGARGGQSGVGFTDIPPPSSPPPGPAPTGEGGAAISALPSQTKVGVFERVKRKFPDVPGEQELTRAYAPEARRAEAHAQKYGYADLNPAERKLTNLETGEIYNRGRSPDVPQPKTFLNDRVNQLLSEVSVGESGQMLAGPEVAAETRQMTGTESSRQSAAVRRLEKEEERQAKNILSELTQETPTLTETYEAFGEPAARVQSIDAVDTASDQAAAPIERAVQRNEDVDLSAAQSFLNQQRQDLQAKGLSPTRVERVLASNPELIEAAELYASTGDEAVLSRFSDQPSSPVVVKPKTALAVTDELPTGQLFKSGTFGEFVDDLEGKDVNLTNRISSIGAEQQELVGRRKQLEEDSLMIKSAMDREPADKDSYSRMYGQMQYEMQNMPEPASLNVDIGDAIAERDHVRAQLKGLNELGAQQFLIDQTEGMRPFYEVNPATSEIIPETLELRPGRKAIELTKGGGGRNVGEFSAGGREDDLVQRTIFVPTNEKGSKLPFNPVTTKTRAADDAGNQLTGFEGDRTQTGGRAGLYGPERTGRKGERATAGQRPTQVTEDELINQALMDSTPDELGVPTPPDRDLVFVDRQVYQRPASRVMDSLKASEAVRRAKIEGRDPQQVLRSMGFGV